MDRSKKPQMSGKCEINNGLYVFNSNLSKDSNHSLTSFAEIEQKSKENGHQDLSSKFKNFNLSKYLNIDIRSPSKQSVVSANSSSKSSSLSNKSSCDSMEQAIIMNGLQRAGNGQNSSYLGPFNFRQLLKPTPGGPTESLRKRKNNSVFASPPSQKGKNI